MGLNIHPDMHCKTEWKTPAHLSDLRDVQPDLSDTAPVLEKVLYSLYVRERGRDGKSSGGTTL